MKLALAFTLALALTTSAAAAPQCKTGIACGNTCIAKGKVCHVAPVTAKHCKDPKTGKFAKCPVGCSPGNMGQCNGLAPMP